MGYVLYVHFFPNGNNKEFFCTCALFYETSYFCIFAPCTLRASFYPKCSESRICTCATGSSTENINKKKSCTLCAIFQSQTKFSIICTCAQRRKGSLAFNHFAMYFTCTFWCIKLTLSKKCTCALRPTSGVCSLKQGMKKHVLCVHFSSLSHENFWSFFSTAHVQKRGLAAQKTPLFLESAHVHSDLFWPKSTSVLINLHMCS